MLDAGQPPRPAPVPGPSPEAPCGDADLAAADRRFTRIAAAVGAATHRSGGSRTGWSDRVDQVATHPVAGPVVFLAVMWVVFQLTTRVAAPVQGFLDGLVRGPVSSAARCGFGALGLGGGAVEGLVVDGLVAGVGMVLTFVPLMTIMFALLAVLEDWGTWRVPPSSPTV